MALLIPKQIPKRRYFHKTSFKGTAKGNKKNNFGDFGLMACEGNWITNNQIESARKVISRYVKNFGKIFINIFPHLPKTKKPLETRMGSGKGSVDKYVATVKKGTVMFEIKLNELEKHKEIAIEALKQSAYKLPIRCKVIVS